MHQKSAFATSVVLIAFVIFPTIHGATVELNVVPGGRAPFNAAQEWARSLEKLKSVSVRVGGGSAPSPEVKQSGSSIRVTAVIDDRNQLVVPGKRFGIRQTGALQTWLDQLSDPQDSAGGKDRFGLTKKQLEQTHESLKTIVSGSTKGRSVATIAVGISKLTRLPLRASSGVKSIMREANVEDEWQGLSSGTTLAAVLRPLELVMVPKLNPAGRVELWITAEQVAKESWPVGWKSQLSKRELVPKIYDPLPIDIADTPIADVIAAVTGRLETPVFYDTALLELLKIDPAKTPVTYYSKRTIYTKALSLTLSKAQLKYELRVDERGKPFIWILPRRVPKSKR